MTWYRFNDTSNSLTIFIFVKPFASVNKISGFMPNNDALIVNIKAPAAEGKANAALCSFLAAKFELSASKVAFLKGKRSRYKQIVIKDIDKTQTNQIIDTCQGEVTKNRLSI